MAASYEFNLINVYPAGLIVHRLEINMIFKHKSRIALTQQVPFNDLERYLWFPGYRRSSNRARRMVRYLIILATHSCLLATDIVDRPRPLPPCCVRCLSVVFIFWAGLRAVVGRGDGGALTNPAPVASTSTCNKQTN